MQIEAGKFKFEELPVICLSKIEQHLSTYDLINLLRAIYDCDFKVPSEWPKLYLFNLLLNPRFALL